MSKDTGADKAAGILARLALQEQDRTDFDREWDQVVAEYKFQLHGPLTVDDRIKIEVGDLS